MKLPLPKVERSYLIKSSATQEACHKLESRKQTILNLLVIERCNLGIPFTVYFSNLVIGLQFLDCFSFLLDEISLVKSQSFVIDLLMKISKLNPAR